MDPAATVVPVGEREMAKKRDFTIERSGGRMERTVVGIDGQKHVLDENIVKQGKDGHFKDEGKYRSAIERAVAENKQ